MKSNIIVCKNHQEASLRAAELTSDVIARTPHLTATFAAGNTPLDCYRELLRRQKEEGLLLDRARYIGLDEWVGLGPNDAGSCFAIMNPNYYLPADIPVENIYAFDGLTSNLDVEAARMQETLSRYPLDLAVLGIGVNGHVGFNEPGIPTTGDFSLVSLSESTQTVGRKYFAGNSTPTEGATITLQALKRAKTVVIIATGANKREAVSTILSGSDQLPAGAFLDHPGAIYVLDEDAAGQEKR